MLINNYEAVFMPQHKRAMSNGMVYEHIIAAEKMLGRELKDGEVVHHKDHCRNNNNPENLMVFKGHADHARYHAYGKCVQMDDGAFISPHEGKVRTRHGLYDECPVCGGLKTTRSKMCDKCNKARNGKPSKEVLVELVHKYNNNKSAIARLYGVSESAVRKWIKNYKL